MGTPRRVTVAVALLPLALMSAGCGTERPGDAGALPADVRGIDVPTAALAPVMPDPITAEPAAAAQARVTTVRAAIAVPAPTRTELDDVPDAALTAYHRGATIMGEAAPGCGLEWALLAAIGRVETKHGHGRLDDVGLARPALVGVPLNGRRTRPRVRDTDAGQLDGDRRWDRVVGPFRVLPSTWSVVAVDADGDDRRDPQDVDDAALGTAVLLCGTRQDLSTREGMRKALRKLRTQVGYPAAVLGWYDAYVEAERSMAESISVVAYGDWSGAVLAVTEMASATRTMEPAPAPTPEPAPKRKPKPKPAAAKAEDPADEPAEDPQPAPEPSPVAEPAEEPVSEPAAEPVSEPAAEPAEEPTKPPADEPTGTPCEPTDPTDPTEEPSPAPAPEPTDEATTEPEDCTP